jgi:hypothetical protein
MTSKLEEALMLYASGEYENAGAITQELLTFHRFSIPKSLRDHIRLEGFDLDVVTDDAPSSFIRGVVALHLAIEYKLGRELPDEILSKHLNIHYSASEPEISISATGADTNDKIDSGTDYAKSNDLIRAVRNEHLMEARSLFREMRCNNFSSFKGSKDDLELIEAILDSSSSTPKPETFSSTLIAARNRFRAGELDESKKLLKKLQKLVHRNTSKWNLVAWNLALLAICEENYEESLRIFDGTDINRAPWSVFAHYYLALVVCGHEQRLEQFLHRIPSRYIPRINLFMSVYYCSRDEWEKGLGFLVKASGEWATVKHTVLAFLMCVGGGRVQVGQFENWNRVVDQLHELVGKKGDEEAKILSDLIRRVKLPTLLS